AKATGHSMTTSASSKSTNGKVGNRTSTSAISCPRKYTRTSPRPSPTVRNSQSQQKTIKHEPADSTRTSGCTPPKQPPPHQTLGGLANQHGIRHNGAPRRQA